MYGQSLSVIPAGSSLKMISTEEWEPCSLSNRSVSLKVYRTPKQKELPYLFSGVMYQDVWKCACLHICGWWTSCQMTWHCVFFWARLYFFFAGLYGVVFAGAQYPTVLVTLKWLGRPGFLFMQCYCLFVGQGFKPWLTWMSWRRKGKKWHFWLHPGEGKSCLFMVY